MSGIRRFKRGNRAALTRNLDKVFSRLVRSRGVCEAKGQAGKADCNPETHQCAHIFSRKNRGTRWDEKNALCLCAFHHAFWAHQNPVEFSEFVREHLGEREYEMLRYRASAATKFSLGELQLLLEDLKRKEMP